VVGELFLLFYNSQIEIFHLFSSSIRLRQKKTNSFEHDSHIIELISYHPTSVIALKYEVKPSIPPEWHPQQLLSLSYSLPFELNTLARISMEIVTEYFPLLNLFFVASFSLSTSLDSDNKFQDCQSLSFNSQSIFLLHFSDEHFSIFSAFMLGNFFISSFFVHDLQGFETKGKKKVSFLLKGVIKTI
jgi:hypothetical protein